MKNTIIIGANSQIGLALKKNNKFKKFFFLEKSQFNITNKKSITSNFKKFKPELILNFSAYTNVSKAESDLSKAYKLNAHCLKFLSEICNLNDCMLVHFSTDYVYDGTKKTKYNEKDDPNPQTIYGKSKLLGEETIKQYSKNFIIFRISHLYSHYKKNIILNFADSIINYKKLRVIHDNYFIPTSTDNLIILLNKIFNNLDQYKYTNKIFNYCDNGSKTNPYELSIYLSKILNKNSNNIEKINTNQYNSQINRPKNSSLDNKKTLNFFKINPKDWKTEIESIINLLYKN